MLAKDEIIVLYGEDYIEMTKRLAKEAGLCDLIRKKMEDKKPGQDPLEAKIILKPNLVAPVMAFEGATTHPEIVEGLILYLREAGFRHLSVCESSWVGDRTEDAFDLCGYYRMADRLDFPLIDIKKEKAVPVDCAGMELMVAACAVNCDYLINIPVLKGHCQTAMTCALKNLKGLLPDSQKRAFHRMGLHDPIGHLSAGIHQDFILVDSICGDLTFEDGGHPVKQDRMFAACDPVLLDAYCAGLLGLTLSDVPYIKIAEACGVGSADMDKARIVSLNEGKISEELPAVTKMLHLKEVAEDVESCSACFGNLMPALEILEEDGLLSVLKEKLGNNKLSIGQGNKKKTGLIGIGNCTKGFQHSVKGCPPERDEIVAFLKHFIAEV